MPTASTPKESALDEHYQIWKAQQEQAKIDAATAKKNAKAAEKAKKQAAKEAKAKATAEANIIIAAAQAEAQQQTVKAREVLREQVAALAVKGAEQILRKEVNAGVHAELLGRLKTEL